MPIEMPKGLPFSVDTFTPSSKKKRHYFLTHAHKDHTVGISSHSHYPIYSTHITKSLLLYHYSQLDESLFVGIEVGQTLFVDDPDGEFKVSAYDANHCPGMLYFAKWQHVDIMVFGRLFLTDITLDYILKFRGKATP